jgi:hypothetical protein
MAWNPPLAPYPLALSPKISLDVGNRFFRKAMRGLVWALTYDVFLCPSSSYNLSAD